MTEAKETNFIRQVLTTEVKYIVAIAVFVFGVAKPYYGMKEDIALIQKDISVINANHEVHIQDIFQEIKEIKAQELDLQRQIILLNNNKK
jgi:hypothetical protein